MTRGEIKTLRTIRWSERFSALRAKHDAELLAEVERQIGLEEQIAREARIRADRETREAIARAFGRPAA